MSKGGEKRVEGRYRICKRPLGSERIDRRQVWLQHRKSPQEVSPGWSTRPDYAEPYWLY